MAQEREILSFNVELKCDHRCEGCERFFDCTDDRKLKVYKRRRMGQAVKKMANIKHKISISGGKGGVGEIHHNHESCRGPGYDGKESNHPGSGF